MSGSATIQLSKGQIAIVDAADAEWLNQWKWYALKTRRGWYAFRNSEAGGAVYMHRAIMNAPKGIQVDHEDGNGLNNRRGNLRPATSQQNASNRGPQKNNTSGLKGVCWNKNAGKWQARIKAGGREIYLGLFSAKEDAGEAYAQAAQEHHGEFACLRRFA